MRVPRSLPLVCSAILLIVVGAVRFGASTGRAQQAASPSSSIDSMILKGLQWRSIGPARGGRSIAVSGVKGRPTGSVLRRGRRRPVEDRRRRRELAAGDRRADQQRLGRRRRGVRDQPRHRFHRHGRVVHPRQHHAGRRRLQVCRRRQDVDARRLLRLAGDLQDPHPPHQPRHRVRRLVRQVRRRQRRARRLQDPPTAARRGSGSCFATPRPAPSIWRSIARNPTVMYAALWEAYRVEYQMSSGGPGQRPVQVDRRRRNVDGDHAQHRPAVRDRRQDRRLGLRRRLEPRLRARRERERRPLLVRRCRHDVDAREREPQHPPARVLLHARRRRSGRTATPSTCSTSACIDRPTAARRSTTLGGSHSDHHDLWIDPDDPKHLVLGNDGGGAVSVARPARAGRRRTSRRRSTTTWSRPDTCPTTSAARSRTAAPSACRATRRSAVARRTRRWRRRRWWTRRGARRSTAPAAPNPATSRPIRATPTSSTPAATTARS